MNKKKFNKKGSGARHTRSSDRKPEGNYNRRETRKDKEALDAVYCNDKPQGGQDKYIGNDPAWYATNPVIKQQITKASFFNATGDMLNVPGLDQTYNTGVPGIMRIQYVPTFGYANSATDPLNAIANNMYTYINSRNSRNTSYDPNDLMLYLICVDSAMIFLGMMRRIYGTLNFAYSQNRYLPEALVSAVGGKYSDLKRHISELQSYINHYTNIISTMVLPSNMPIFKRHQFLVNHFFSDTASAKSQVYTFVPDGLYVFALDEDKAGYAQWEPFSDLNDPAFTLTFDQITALGNKLIESIRYTYGQQDFNTISADIIKAFGDANVYNYDYMPENYMTTPSDDEWLHMQIQNLTGFGYLDSNSLVIQQDATKSFLVSAPTKTIQTKNIPDTSPYTAARLVNTYSDNPSEDEILEITRLTNIPKIRTQSASSATLAWTSFASEITTRWSIYVLQRDPAGIASVVNTGEINSFLKICNELE